MNDILKQELNRLIRYAFPGFFAMWLYSCINPTEFKLFIDRVGNPMAYVFALVIGSVIFVLYRLVVGEFCLFPFVNWWHDKRYNKDKCNKSITSWLVSEHGVDKFRAREAYGYLKRNIGDDKETKYFDFIHTELHILYLSSTILIFSSFYHLYIHQFSYYFSAIILFVLGLLILLAAIASDRKTHVSEYLYFSHFPESDKIRSILLKAGFTQKHQ